MIDLHNYIYIQVKSIRTHFSVQFFFFVLVRICAIGFFTV